MSHGKWTSRDKWISIYLLHSKAQIFVEDVAIENLNLALDKLGKGTIATNGLAEWNEQWSVDDLLLKSGGGHSNKSVRCMSSKRRAEQTRSGAENLSCAEQSFLGRMSSSSFLNPGKSRSIFSSRILPRKPVTPKMPIIWMSANQPAKGPDEKTVPVRNTTWPSKNSLMN